jgi:hypothetical protein
VRKYKITYTNAHFTNKLTLELAFFEGNVQKTTTYNIPFKLTLELAFFEGNVICRSFL